MYKNIDLRLTKLLVNTINPSEFCSEIYYVNDNQLIDELTQFNQNHDE